MPAGPNLRDGELQQLQDLLMTFQRSQEFEATANSDDYEAIDSTIILINYARAGRPEEHTDE